MTEISGGERLRRVLITGGAGFIGSHLVEGLLEGGLDTVTVLDNLSEGSLSNLDSVARRIRMLKLDLRLDTWHDILMETDYDCIFHLAGNADVQTSVSKPHVDFKLNLEPTFRLLEAIRKLKWGGRLIFASSAAAYGSPAVLPIRETHATNPLSPYGVSKLAAERYVAAYSALYGIKAASMRTASAYGPRLRKQVVYDLFQKILHQPNEVVIFGDGSQTRDFIFVKDIVMAAIGIAMRGKLGGEVYNVATGRSYSILQLAGLIGRDLGVTPRFRFTGGLRAGEPDCWTFDIGRLRALGCRPCTPLRTGLSRTRQWIVENDGEKQLISQSHD